MTEHKNAAEWWYITTDFFANGGKVHDEWGPFLTSEMAMRVRALVEKEKGRYDLFVDKRRAQRCTALGKGINGKVLGCALPRDHEGPHQDEGATWVATEPSVATEVPA